MDQHNETVIFGNGAKKRRASPPFMAEMDKDRVQADNVEAFLPTDYFSDSPKKPARKKAKKKRLTRKKKIMLLALAGALVLLLGAGATYVYNLRYNPGSFFQSGSAPSASSTPATQSIFGPQATPTPTPAPTDELSAYEKLVQQSDPSLAAMGGILNVAVIGVDYAEERETWNGKHDYHADVIMIIAVNFNENRVDLISIPRDTYAKIPGVKGIYKINASINCGGGLEAEGGAGFLKVCETASWELGGIPVNYYYAVTMPAVKSLVDAFGGVDYDLELSFKMAGRSYTKGQQHMNGQAVLDYLRVRKNVDESGDLNRVNRQKQMMIALFRQMQQNNLIVKIPDIIGAFEGQLFTNCTLAQTAALASFAYNLDSENIGMHSIGGRMTSIFNWNFVLTDQSKRVSIIKEVYGIDVNKELQYTSDYASYRWQSMLAEQYLRTCKNLKSFTANVIKTEALIPDPTMPPAPTATPEIVDPGTAPPASGTPGGETPPIVGGETPTTSETVPAVSGNGVTTKRLSTRGFMPSTFTNGYTQSQLDAYNAFIAAYQNLLEAVENADKQADKYLAGKKNSFSGAVDTLTSCNENLKNAALAAKAAFAYTGGLSWSVKYEKDTSVNAVYVDFR